MNATLIEIKTLLEAIISDIDSSSNDEPFGIGRNDWTTPNLTAAELIEEAQNIVDLIEEEGEESLGEHEARLEDYVRRLQFLKDRTLPQLQHSPMPAILAYLITLQGLRKALSPILKGDKRAKADAKLKELKKRLRAMEAELNDLEPRTVDLNTMVERIEKAHDTADQLPTDLDSLSEARKKIEGIAEDVAHRHNDVKQGKEHAAELEKQLEKNAKDAEDVLKRCVHAYSAATSVGLAAAFSERSSALSKTLLLWVAGLIVALALGSYIGTNRLNSLGKSFEDPNISVPVIVLNFLLSLLSIGAPVWFAWLSTKQIGQRFRLAEDYAFKASISRAYEGFRREAARFDKDMESKLLISALTRFDELPLRLIETENYGSPWHELASSKVVKQAIQTIPDFVEKVEDFAADKLTKNESARHLGKSRPAVSTVTDNITDSHE